MYHLCTPAKCNLIPGYRSCASHLTCILSHLSYSLFTSDPSPPQSILCTLQPKERLGVAITSGHINEVRKRWGINIYGQHCSIRTEQFHLSLQQDNLYYPYSGSLQIRKRRPAIRYEPTCVFFLSTFLPCVEHFVYYRHLLAAELLIMGPTCKMQLSRVHMDTNSKVFMSEF